MSELSKQVQDALERARAEIASAAAEVEACERVLRRANNHRIIEADSVAIPQDKAPYLEAVQPEPKPKAAR